MECRETTQLCEILAQKRRNILNTDFFAERRENSVGWQLKHFWHYHLTLEEHFAWSLCFFADFQQFLTLSGMGAIYLCNTALTVELWRVEFQRVMSTQSSNLSSYSLNEFPSMRGQPSCRFAYRGRTGRREDSYWTACTVPSHNLYSFFFTYLLPIQEKYQYMRVNMPCIYTVLQPLYFPRYFSSGVGCSHSST